MDQNGLPDQFAGESDMYSRSCIRLCKNGVTGANGLNQGWGITNEVTILILSSQFQDQLYDRVEDIVSRRRVFRNFQPYYPDIELSIPVLQIVKRGFSLFKSGFDSGLRVQNSVKFFLEPSITLVNFTDDFLVEII